MSQHDSELCVLLVEDIYGELASHLLRILLCFGRLSVPALRQHTCLSIKLIKHGLAVLVRHQLALWYTSDNNSTVYEANPENTYNLTRIGKYVRIVEERFGSVSAEMFAKLMTIGHASIGDIVQQCSKVGANQVNGASADDGEFCSLKGLRSKADHNSVQANSVRQTLHELLQFGVLIRIHASHFRPNADNRIEAEKVVPPVGEYKAKSKRENEAQWELSIQKQLDEWKHNPGFNSDRPGKKRSLEDPEVFRPHKRQRHDNLQARHDVGVTSSNSHLQRADSTYLDDTTVLGVNHRKFAVMMRNDSLVDLADKSISTSTAKVYKKFLYKIESHIRECKVITAGSGGLDTDPETSPLLEVSTDKLLTLLDESSELVNALGKVNASRANHKEVDHPKKQRRKRPESHDEAMVNGKASSDEDEVVSDSADNDSAVSSDTEDSNGGTEYNEDSRLRLPKDSHRETIRDHLLLLARHPHKFLHHLPQTPILPEKWTVHFPSLVKHLKHHTVMQTITARHHVHGARITRILAEKGKVDEKTLWTLSLLNQKEMRKYISALHKAGVIRLQEVPRDNSRNPQRTLYLWFFDEDRCESKMLEEAYKSMALCLQRARVEGDKVKGTVEKASRSDVVGREEEFLGIHEREALENWRNVETKLRSEVDRLDDLVAVIRDF